MLKTFNKLKCINRQFPFKWNLYQEDSNNLIHSHLSSVFNSSKRLQNNSIRFFHISRIQSKKFDTILLRDEVKEHEQRTPLLPKQVQTLINSGYKVLVESSLNRIYPDSAYKEYGATIIPNHSYWDKNYTTDSTIVLGLKELPTEGTILKNISGKNIVVPNSISGTHIYFAHSYKYQSGWDTTLKRYNKGNGNLLDLEYLVNDDLQRIAAFGTSAGYAGMALGLLTWIKQVEEVRESLNSNASDKIIPFDNSPIHPYSSKSELVNEIQTELKRLNVQPRISVVGPYGRCGTGTLECIKDIFGNDYKNIILWDKSDTDPSRAPFRGMIESDILINDIFAAGDMEPFFTLDYVQNYDSSKRKLGVFVDVSCDITSKKKAFPLNDSLTSFDEPRRRILSDAGNLPLDIIAIDNLPTLLPSLSSSKYSEDLLPYILALKDVDFSETEWNNVDLWKKDWINSPFQWKDPKYQQIRVWHRANQLFQKKKNEALNLKSN